MTTKILLLLPLALLAACATPREACLADATRELRTLTRLAAETRANVLRGYAIEQTQELRERRTLCEIDRDDGTTDTEFCTVTQVVERSRPVAIDIAGERRKLAQLEARIEAEQARVAAVRRQCLAAYPA